MTSLRARWTCPSIRNGVASLLPALLLFSSQVIAQAAASSPQQQVLAAERAFARSMADRDIKAFAAFVSDEAIFLNGSTALRGRAQVVSGWAKLFEGTPAPFSWDPDQVEVLDSGGLALSTGLVRDPAGKVIGRFNSIWRLESPGTWRVVFDKGSPAAEAEQR